MAANFKVTWNGETITVVLDDGILRRTDGYPICGRCGTPVTRMAGRDKWAHILSVAHLGGCYWGWPYPVPTEVREALNDKED